jgi:hypothetical protein
LGLPTEYRKWKVGIQIFEADLQEVILNLLQVERNECSAVWVMLFG